MELMPDIGCATVPGPYQRAVTVNRELCTSVSGRA